MTPAQTIAEPPRDRTKAALDTARAAFDVILRESRESETLKYVREKVKPRIAEILGETK